MGLCSKSEGQRQGITTILQCNYTIPLYSVINAMTYAVIAKPDTETDTKKMQNVYKKRSKTKKDFTEMY